MTDTVKLIIEISKSAYEEMSKHGTSRVDYDIQQMINNGIPLDDVKAEIDRIRPYNIDVVEGLEMALDILDNIGKAESEGE